MREGGDQREYHRGIILSSPEGKRSRKSEVTGFACPNLDGELRFVSKEKKGGWLIRGWLCGWNYCRRIGSKKL